MEFQHLDLLLRLLLAHLLADFIIQTDKIVQEKKNGLRSRAFYYHILAVGILTYIILAQFSNWWAPLVMMIMHAFIDILKIKLKSSKLQGFLFDQLLHMVSIALLWILISGIQLNEIGTWMGGLKINLTTWIVLIAYILMTIPTSVFIGHLTRQWQEDLPNEQNDGLKDAGKSIFRFGDLNNSGDRKKTEYILIGTLISFASAICIGLLVHKIALVGPCLE